MAKAEELFGDDILEAWQEHIDKVATTVGMEVVDYLYGIELKIKHLNIMG